MTYPLKINTKRCCITSLRPIDALLMKTYYVENKSHLKPWEPPRGEEYYSLSGWQYLLSRHNDACNAGRGVYLCALDTQCSTVIAVMNFTNILHGSVKSCGLGYSIAKKYQGQGYMYEALAAAIPMVMKQYRLHRINASYLPHNQRSANLLKRLGFEKEGYARSYLNIDGEWRDHVLTGLVNPHEND